MYLKKDRCDNPVIKSSDFLLNLRLCIFSVAWVHLIVAAVIILPIDMSSDDDPRVRAYVRLKWRFITAWFNLISLAYLPVCCYCDWKEKKREADQRHVVILRRIRDLVFTSILFPTVMYGDILFWRLYLKDPTLIAPIALFRYLPDWGQHSLHTVSLVVAVLDLVLVPRRRPSSVKPRLLAMTVFFAVYALSILERYLKGDVVYQLLETLSKTDTLLLLVMFYIEYLLYFTVQWKVVDFVWGAHSQNLKKKLF